MGSIENEERVMTSIEAAEYLGVHLHTIYRYIKKGLLSDRRYTRYPRKLFVTEASVLELESARLAKKTGSLVEIMVRIQRLERRLDALEFGSLRDL